MLTTIFVDYQNLYKSCEDKVRVEDVLGEILKRVQAKGDEVYEFRLFVPSYQSGGPLKMLNALQRKFGFEISCCLSLGADGDIKDTVDFEVLRYVMQNIHAGVGPEAIIFITGDGDFLVASNEAKRRGKDIRFWFVDSGNVNRMIREEEKFAELKIAPPIVLSEENRFISTFGKMQAGEELDEEDLARLRLVGQMSKDEIANTTGSSREELLLNLAKKLGTTEDETEELLKALMALGVLRIYPMLSTGICVDANSILFGWSSSLVNNEE